MVDLEKVCYPVQQAMLLSSTDYATLSCSIPDSISSNLWFVCTVYRITTPENFHSVMLEASKCLSIIIIRVSRGWIL